MILKDPCIITSRLMPGVAIGGARISIGWSKRPGGEGRARAEYWIDLPDGTEHHGDDLQSGVGGGNLREMLVSLLSFLGACGESVNYGQRTGRDGENANLFPPPVAQWADENSDELACVGCDIEENPDCMAD